MVKTAPGSRGAFLLAALAATACARTTASRPVAQPPIAATTSDVSAAPSLARLRADVAYLAGDALRGRQAGTPDADAAAAHIGEAFRRLGLSPAGDAGTYFQKFDFISGVELGTRNRLATSAKGALGTVWNVGIDFRPLAFSASGEASGEVVFAGYGIVSRDLSYDDYAGLDVKGKLVLVLRYGPDGDDERSPFSPHAPLRNKAALARDRGAKALLVATGPLTKGVADDLVALRTDSSLSDSGLPVVSVKRNVAEALFSASGKSLKEAQQAIDASRKPASLPLPLSFAELVTDVRPTRAVTSNVLGVLEGGDPALKKELVVIGAHYDHLGLGKLASLDPDPVGKIHHGADDNASGVATLLELARMLTAKDAQRPRRSLLVAAFGAEEEGTLGSLHFIKSRGHAIDDVVAMFNFDMVGRLREGKLEVHGVGTADVWKALLAEASEKAGLTLKTHEGGFGPSDHSPFYAAGRPVLFAFTGAHADYHRPSDTEEKLNYEGMASIVKLMRPVVLAIANGDKRPDLKRPSGDGAPVSASRGFRVYVGTIPDYSEEASGVKLSGVSPGSPAENAGLQAGDVIVRFGEREVKNIYDYTHALSDHKPGDVVEVVVKRPATNGSEPVVKTLAVTLGSRPSATK